MRSALTSPHHAGSLLICKQFGGIAIATEASLVAIPEQIRCKRGRVPCTVARLMAEFGRELDVTNLRKMRQLYRRFEIRDAPRFVSAVATICHTDEENH